MCENGRADWIDLVRSLGPADLHRHTDGLVRPSILWDLSRRYSSAIPGMDLAGFERMLRYDPATESSLLAYLDKFHVPLQYTQFYDREYLFAIEAFGLGEAEVRRLVAAGRSASFCSRSIPLPAVP